MIFFIAFKTFVASILGINFVPFLNNRSQISKDIFGSLYWNCTMSMIAMPR